MAEIRRQPLGDNGGETIRIGDSGTSMQDSRTIVEYNYFEECDGEAEIVSSKSGFNIYQFNTFYNSDGQLTLRHGNDCEVRYNFFFGNKKSGSSGVRIIGERHKVINNYFQDLNSTKDTRGAIAILGGQQNPALAGYWAVKDAVIAHNTIVNCVRTINLGVDQSGRSGFVPPSNCIIADNILYGTSGPLINVINQGVNFTYEGNIYYGASLGLSSSGFTNADPKLAKDTGMFGLWRIGGNSPAVNAATGKHDLANDCDMQQRDSQPDIGADEYLQTPILFRPVDRYTTGPCWMSGTCTANCNLSATATVTSADDCGNATGSAQVAATGGSGSYSYTWSNGATAANVSGLAAGKYTVTVAEGNCSSVQTITVPFNACYTGLCFEAEAATLTSPMQAVQDEAVSQQAYVMSGTEDAGTAVFSFTVDTPGNYSLTARIRSENTSSDSYYFAFDNETEDIWDFNPANDPALHGVWFMDALSKRGTGTFNSPEADPYIIALSQGNHTLTFRTREPNARLDYLCLEWMGATTGTSDKGEERTFILYPNPTRGSLRFEVGGLMPAAGNFNLTPDRNRDYNLQLFDIHGRALYRSTLHTPHSTLDISHLPDGVYLLVVSGEHSRFTNRVVKY